MSRRLLYVILSSLLAVAAVGLWRWGPYLFSGNEVSDLYRRYEHNPHVVVSYLRSYPLNDTLTIPVTLLRATDSIGWDSLLVDFNVAKLPPHIQKVIDDGKDYKSLRLTPKDHLGQPMDTTNTLNNDVIGVSRLYKRICIFHTHTLEQIDAVLEKQFP